MTDPNDSKATERPNCPVCGYPMNRMSGYAGGTASHWSTSAVSSSSSDVAFIYYPEQDVYLCTNPETKHKVLMSRRG